MPDSTRLPLILKLRDQLGLSDLAQVEVELVRQRPVPARLITALLRPDPPEVVLSPAERRVMVLLTSGFTREEIAEELGVTVETVKSHLQRTYGKLGVHRQIEAINAFLDRAA